LTLIVSIGNLLSSKKSFVNYVMKNLIVLVEDDPMQAESVKRAIERHFPGFEVEVVETEMEFRERLVRIPTGGDLLRLVVSCVLLTWAYPEPNPSPVPTEVLEGTFKQGGTRCRKEFRKREDLAQIPWIHWTVLNELTINLQGNWDRNTGYVHKSGSIYPLVEEIRFFLNNSAAKGGEEFSPGIRRALLEEHIRLPAECVGQPV
jgi:DNA-binding NarL/FixJ family response regulator